MKLYLEIIAIFVVSLGLEKTGFRTFFLLYIHRDGVSATLLVMGRQNPTG